MGGGGGRGGGWGLGGGDGGACGLPPRIAEVGGGVGVRATNGVNDHLVALERKGFIVRTRRIARGIMVIRSWSCSVEKKYTEEYKSNKLPSKDNIVKRRWDTYQEDFQIWRADNPDVPTYENYFVEPFYQLMRQSVLADKM